jgi:Lon protease-like protein
VITFFTPTNNHVIYYNKGKRTIRVFRAGDGRQIADMRCSAKVRQALATNDGRVLVVGYEDGAVQAFLIVDPYESSSIPYLKQWRKHQFESKIEAVSLEPTEKLEE